MKWFRHFLHNQVVIKILQFMQQINMMNTVNVYESPVKFIKSWVLCIVVSLRS